MVGTSIAVTSAKHEGTYEKPSKADLCLLGGFVIGTIIAMVIICNITKPSSKK